MTTHNRPFAFRSLALLAAMLLSTAACTSVDVAPTTTPRSVDRPTEAVEATQDDVVPSPEPSPTTMPTSEAAIDTPIAASPTAAPPTLMMPPTEDTPVCGPADDLDARFVRDLGVADGTRFAPGVTFRKTWLVQNTSTCAWPAGTELVHIEGDVLPGPQRIPVSSTGPGNEIAISVAFDTPTRPGAHTSFWRLRAPEAGLFGAVVFVDIIVDPDAPQVPPTATRPAGATATTTPPTATRTPIPPTLQPTATPSPRPSSPTPSPTPVPSPTASPGSQDSPAAACTVPDSRFLPVIDQAAPLGIRFSCANGPVGVAEGSLQTFWADVEEGDADLRFRSLVILREDTDKIYVLTGRDASTYLAQVTPCNATTDVDPDERAPACAPLVPPEDYVVPTGSIGDAWCRRSLWASIGWPRDAASPASLEMQETDNGLLIRATTDPAALDDPGVTLVAIDFDTMNATVRRMP